MKQPERWVCSGCENVVASRPARIKGQCRRCPAKEGEKPFKKGKNLCIDCFNEEMREWRVTSEKWQEKKKDPVFLSKRHTAVKKSVQRSPHAFVRYLTRMLTRGHRYTRINERSDKRKVNPVCLDVQITPEFTMSLWESQKGKCALTGLPMTHQFCDLNAASIDRRDSQKGYIPGNVQLVCQWASKAKGNHPDTDFKNVLTSLVDSHMVIVGERPSLVTEVVVTVSAEIVAWLRENHWKRPVRVSVAGAGAVLSIVIDRLKMSLPVDPRLFIRLDGSMLVVREEWDDLNSDTQINRLGDFPLEDPGCFEGFFGCVGAWLSGL